MPTHDIAGIGYMTGQWPLDPDKPTLVFIHGAGLNHVFWQQQLHGLKVIANTVALDLPGHALSAHHACSHSIEDYAAVLHAFITAAKLPTPIPCGHSMGGAIVQQLLLKHAYPGAILINTGAKLRVQPEWLQLLQHDYAGFMQRLIHTALPDDDARTRLRPQLAAALDGNAWIARNDFDCCEQFDLMAQLNRIQTPLLVLTAADDQLTPPHYGTYLATHIAQAQLQQVPNAGHFSPLEQPLLVNHAIMDFLHELPLPSQSATLAEAPS